MCRNINSRFVSYVVSNLQVPLCVGICFDGVEFSKNPWNSVGEEVPLGCVPYHKVDIGWTRILVYNLNCQNEAPMIHVKVLVLQSWVQMPQKV